MAAITVTSTLQESMGSLKLIIVTSSDFADGATYTQAGIKGVVGYWANCESAETAGDEGVNVDFVAATGVFTLGMKTQGIGKLFIMLRSG